MDCTSETLTAEEYLQCLPQAMDPVIDALFPVLSIVVLVSVLFAGIKIVQRVINAANEGAS